MSAPASGAVFRLPPEQLERALAAYRSAVVAKRLRLLLGAVILLFAIWTAGIVGEVDLAKFFANIDRLPNYIWNSFPR